MIYLILILSVIFGFSLVLILKPKTKQIQLFLSFSGAYLLSITVLHLIPDVFESQQKNIGIYILFGIILQTALEYLSKGAEHGHFHAHELKNHVPWLLFISLSLHAFLEGMPLGLNGENTLLWAIVVHKIPIAIILGVFLKNSNLSTGYTILFLSIFAIMSPLGSLVANELYILQQFENELNALVIGIFLHISTAILFESSDNHQFNLKKFIAILVGFAVAFISL